MSCAYVNTVIYYEQYCYRVMQFLDTKFWPAFLI